MISNNFINKFSLQIKYFKFIINNSKINKICLNSMKLLLL